MSDTYAPQSPDLSGFYSSADPNPTPLQEARNQAQAAQQLKIETSQSNGPSSYQDYYSAGPHPVKREFPYDYSTNSARKRWYSPQDIPASAYPGSYQQPASSSFPQASPIQQHHAPYQQDPQPYYPPVQYQPPGVHQQYVPPINSAIPPSSAAATASLLPGAGTLEMPPRKAAAAAASSSSAGIMIDSPVKTKFPTARIKRIMQADEEVGKVAQQTPIAVGKALELFMVQLVTRSAEVAREKNSKRVTAQMLKQVVETDDQWDFLRDIVAKVDGSEDKGGTGKAAKSSKAESDSDDEDAAPKKKGKGGRKKKA